MIKLIGAYLLLLLYIISIFRPILPLIDYLINYDYIAEQLCENRNKPILACNGKCYVAKEIVKTLPATPIENKSKTLTIDFNKYPVITLFINKYSIFYFNHIQKYKFKHSISIEVKDHIKYIFRPPKNLV